MKWVHGQVALLHVAGLEWANTLKRQTQICTENQLPWCNLFRQHTENHLWSLTCVLSTHCPCHSYRPQPMAAGTLTILANNTDGIVDFRRRKSLAYLAMSPAKNQTEWCPAVHSWRQKEGASLSLLSQSRCENCQLEPPFLTTREAVLYAGAATTTGEWKLTDCNPNSLGKC